jgi:hypothetical protein
MGRKRKFVEGEIVGWNEGVVQIPARFMVVDYRFKDSNWYGEYLVIPLDSMGRKAGGARWVKSNLLSTTDEHSQGQHRKTYRINRWLGEQIDGGRECYCQCCPHIAEEIRNYNHKGEPK